MFTDYHNKINNSIQIFLDELNDSKIYDPIKYFLKLPSKRIRPIKKQYFRNEIRPHSAHSLAICAACDGLFLVIESLNSVNNPSALYIVLISVYILVFIFKKTA